MSGSGVKTGKSRTEQMFSGFRLPFYKKHPPQDSRPQNSNELAPITRSDNHTRIVITMEKVPTCQSAFLFAAGHGLPWTAAILKKTQENLLSPTLASWAKSHCYQMIERSLLI
jgi:hypothetical protein